MNCHWSILLGDGSTVLPSSVTERQQLSLDMVNKKVNNIIDKMLIGQKVLFKPENETIYYEGEVSGDPDNYCSLMVSSEDRNEGLLVLKVYYTISSKAFGLKMLPADCIARVSRPLFKDVSIFSFLGNNSVYFHLIICNSIQLKEDLILFVPYNKGFVPATVRTIAENGTLMAFPTPNPTTYPPHIITAEFSCWDMFKQILL